jgi:hypothetical protein
MQYRSAFWKFNRGCFPGEHKEFRYKVYNLFYSRQYQLVLTIKKTHNNNCKLNHWSHAIFDKQFLRQCHNLNGCVQIVCEDLLFFLRSWGTCCIQSWKGYFICSIINMDGGVYFIVIGVKYIIRQPFYIWILPQVQNVGQFTVYQIHIWTNTVQTLCFNGISIHLLLNNLIIKKTAEMC